MTRKQAHEKVKEWMSIGMDNPDTNWHFGKVELHEVLDIVYDGFESREKAYLDAKEKYHTIGLNKTCGSCSWFSEDENGYVCNQEHQMYTYDDRRADGYLSPDKDFGCNKWEAKDEN